MCAHCVCIFHLIEIWMWPFSVLVLFCFWHLMASCGYWTVSIWNDICHFTQHEPHLKYSFFFLFCFTLVQHILYELKSGWHFWNERTTEKKITQIYYDGFFYEFLIILFITKVGIHLYRSMQWRKAAHEQNR